MSNNNVLFLNFNKKIKTKSSSSPSKIKTVEWRRKKILNPETGKLVYEDSITGKNLKREQRYLKHINCPDGYKYDFTKEKCVKIKETSLSPKKKSILKKKECPVGSIINPLTQKCVKINSPAGKRAIRLNAEKMKIKYEKEFWK